MATFGTRDATQFLLPSVESKERYYTLVERDTGKITLKRIVPLSPNESLDATVGTIETSGTNAGKFVPGAGASATERQAFAQQPQAVKTVKDNATKTVTNAKVKEGTNSQVAQTEANKLLSPNAATTSPSADGSQGASSLTEGQSKALGEENKYKENTRAGDTAYGTDLKYPLNLKSEVQDVIKFSILEYSPSLAKENQSTTGQFGSGKSRVVTLESSGIPIVKGSTRIGVVTLPIPAGISDGNTVGWQGDSLTMLQSEAAGIAQGFLTGGVAGAGERLDATGNKLQTGAQSGDLQSAVTSLFVGSAIANSNIAGRTYGAAGNNNLELLFSNPNLRSFSFAFSFYPRGEDEAVMVRRIIRAFKQSMSVKRSKTSLLLKAPHTFAISYVTAGGKAQPYLNSFKECALTSCSVDYTPDGTYMTYGGKEKSMTAYRLSLQFQELEPIFDDEYFDIDKNKDDQIGF
jgi:hypothetical protein